MNELTLFRQKNRSRKFKEIVDICLWILAFAVLIYAYA